jgi:thiamine biosynthesis lipoprotein
MGSEVHIIAADGPAAALSRASEAIGNLERRWSRFRPDSEVSRLNAADGRPVAVSAATMTLVTLAMRGWEATEGAYDPTVFDAIVAAGYDRPLDQLPTHAPTAEPAPSRPAPGCAGIAVDAEASTVQLPRGVHFDPGGIGKGLAADLVASTLLDDGARGALVNVGGDTRVAGRPPPDGWRIAADLPGPAAVELALHSGAVATSSILHRRWGRAGDTRHHLIDPATGAPATTPFVAVTVVAGGAWWAEVLTKAVMLSGTIDTAARALASADAAALAVDGDGCQHLIADMDRFLR